MPFKTVAIGALMVLVVGPAVAQGTINIKGQQIPLQCSDWKKQDNGSWKLLGLLNMGGGSVTDVTLSGGKEAEELNKMCK